MGDEIDLLLHEIEQRATPEEFAKIRARFTVLLAEALKSLPD
jgi:hypothetical protein